MKLNASHAPLIQSVKKKLHINTVKMHEINFITHFKKHVLITYYMPDALIDSEIIQRQ